MWIYNDKPYIELEDDIIGFVYVITCKKNKKRYFGKKLFKFSNTKIKTVTLKNGKKVKKKIRSKVESDWQQYYGSNEQLKQDVIELGEDNFEREILHLCKSKAECSYLEMKHQIINDVLLYPNLFYNSFVGGKIHRNHLKGVIL